MILKNLNKNVVIIGAGSSIIDNHNNIIKLIKDKECLTIGINNISHLFIPDYHLWTNNSRIKEFGSCINIKSKLLIGSNINKNNIPNNLKYDTVNYIDKDNLELGFNNNIIRGYFRTAGVLAIYIAYLSKAKNIYVVGMDGYSLNFNGNQHCYGSGMTDKNSEEECIKKDKIVERCLDSLKKHGVSFKIITPTVFENHYEKIW